MFFCVIRPLTVLPIYLQILATKHIIRRIVYFIEIYSFNIANNYIIISLRGLNLLLLIMIYVWSGGIVRLLINVDGVLVGCCHLHLVASQL